MNDASSDPNDKLPTSLNERIENFRRRMFRFHKYSWKVHCVYFWLNTFVVFTGLLVAPAITILALTDHTLATAVLAGVMSVLLGIQSSFKLGEHSRHWEFMHNYAKIVRGRLEGAAVRDEAHLASLVESWEQLRIDLLEGLPGPAKLEAKQA